MSRKGKLATSAYLLRSKNWIVRKMVASYFRICEDFFRTNAQASTLEKFPFSKLEQYSSRLYDLKEDHHFLFKRVFGPVAVKKLDHHKLEPTRADIDFVANIGQLFHKTLVARELKYLFSHYDPLTSGTAEIKIEFEAQLNDIHKLFEDGVRVLVELLQTHSSNVLLLNFLLENPRTVRRTMGMGVHDVLRMVTGQKTPNATYYLAGQYYMEGGHYTSAEKMFRRILRRNPKHSEARDALKDVALAMAQLKDAAQ